MLPGCDGDIHHLVSGCLMTLVLKGFDRIICGSHFVTFPLKCKTRACLNFMRPAGIDEYWIHFGGQGVLTEWLGGT